MATGGHGNRRAESSGPITEQHPARLIDGTELVGIDLAIAIEVGKMNVLTRLEVLRRFGNQAASPVPQQHAESMIAKRGYVRFVIAIEISRHDVQD